jgi:hypothetical protein
MESSPVANLGRSILLVGPMLEAMGRELAAIHLGAAHTGDSIPRDLSVRGRAWLADTVLRVTHLVADEHRPCVRATGTL